MPKPKRKTFDLEFFQKHGKRGGKLGGKKSSANMTPEERVERAKKAVAARKWHAPLTPAQKLAKEKAAAKKRTPRKAA